MSLRFLQNVYILKILAILSLFTSKVSFLITSFEYPFRS